MLDPNLFFLVSSFGKLRSLAIVWTWFAVLEKNTSFLMTDLVRNSKKQSQSIKKGTAPQKDDLVLLERGLLKPRCIITYFLVTNMSVLGCFKEVFFSASTDLLCTGTGHPSLPYLVLLYVGILSSSHCILS